MRRLMVGGFWASGAAAAWVLAGYPLALLALRRRPWPRTDRQPRVSIVIPAYCEREALPTKLTSIRELDYPAGQIQVLVAVDGDEELARIAADSAPRATILFEPQRGGKGKALNRALAHADGEIVLLTDANNPLEPGSVAAAMSHFADPEIWAVAGHRGERGSAYDTYEAWIRRLESRSGSVAAASGELIAVRRERLPRFPDGVINDDLWLLCRLVAAGGRVVYEPRARSIEPALPTGAELERRARIGAGKALVLRDLGHLPRDFAWRLASHKAGRLALPFLLLATLATSLSLSGPGGGRWRAVAGAQLGLYAVGALSALGLRPRGPLGLPSRAAEQLLVGNAATAVGVTRAVRGRQDSVWEPVR